MRTRRYLVDPTLPEGEAAAWRPPLEAAGWEQTGGDNWELFLAGSRPPANFYATLRPNQWVNRFPELSGLAVKGDLYENVRAARRWARDGGLARLHPRSFLMPDDHDTWTAAAAAEPEAVWLPKPQASACGRGIALVTDPAEVPQDGDWMVQEYIARPHLLDGYKYGLRFYLLITSLDPLVCYLHRVGTCRFATRPYTLEPASRHDPFVHITNTAVQERNTEVTWWRRNTDLAPYLRRLRAEGLDADRLVADIHDAVTRLVIACREHVLIGSRTAAFRLEGCFELLSLDVLVDDRMQPWILECNAGPPMNRSAWKGTPSSPTDPGYDAAAAAESDAIKGALLSDLISLLGRARAHRVPWPDDDRGYWLERSASELAGAKGWQRLWPRPDADRFVDGFPLLRPRDRLIASWACPKVSRVTPPIRVSPGVDTHRLGDGLALYDPDRRCLYAVNGTAAIVWLGLQNEMTVEDLVDELAEVFGETPRARIDADVWDLLVAWAQKGLIAGFERRVHPESPRGLDGPLALSAVRKGHTLLIPIGSVDLGYLGALEPTALPTPAIRRLVLVFPGDGPRPQLTRPSPSSVLDTLALEAGSALAPDAAHARALIRWLDGLQAVEVSPAVLPVPPAPAPALPSVPAPAPDRGVTIAAVGDIMLARNLTGHMERHGGRYPYARIADLLRRADVTVANLEVALTERGEARDRQDVFRTSPRFAAGLSEAGIDVVSLANDHVEDYGRDGLRDTLATLDGLGVRHAGAGLDETDARRPAIVSAGGLRLACLSYTDISEHRRDGPTPCGVAMASAETIASDVQAACRKAEVVIVSLHAGAEHTAVPGARQRRLARAAVEAGALLVLGHHPHVLQGWERHGRGLIAYSLGNFVSDLEHNPLNLTERAFESVVLFVTLAAGGVRGVRAEPVVIDLTEDRPRPATVAEASAIRGRLDVLSALARAG